MEEYGVKETKEVALSLAHLVGAAVKDLADDSGFDWKEWLPAIMTLPDALKGIGEVPAEVKDISAEEAEEIMHEVSEVLTDYGVAEADVIQAVYDLAKSMVSTIGLAIAAYKKVFPKTEAVG